ncbi:prohibitin family protein [Crocinitomix catalasitica]|uniref:prohibitin family protein n=1 Tax=Crocinitomix catalasitica TaxID=184607 RepID=UPI0004848A63|nr:prohibitin family protein [Crocinitomix catalasitica]
MKEVPVKLIALIAVVVITIVVLFKSSITINSGQNGVLFQTFSNGVYIDQPYDEGFHIIAPWNKMIVYEVRQQKISETMNVLSSNGLEIEVDVTLQFQPVKKTLPLLHKEKGQQYIEDIVRPAIRSATRSVIGRYTPEEIYASKRDVIQDEIDVETIKIIEKQYVQVNEVLVRDITLPPTIKSAIEEKLKKEQESLQYEFRLQKEKKEADRIKIAAQGKADANRILNASLTPNILQEKGIEATLELSKSPNSKVIVIGGGEGGLPIILGNQ